MMVRAMMFKKTSLVLSLCAVLGGGMGLASCAVTEAIQNELFDTSKINLTDSTYAAADMMAQQSRAHVSAATPVQVVALYDVANPNEVTPFGQTLGNQMGTRLVQLGYNTYGGGAVPQSGVSSSVMGPSIGVGAPRPAMKGVQPSLTGGMKPGAVQLGGSYVRGKDTVMVSLQMVEMQSGRILSAYDYTLPMTRQVREMTMTRAEREQARTGMAFGTFIPAQSGSVPVSSVPPDAAHHTAAPTPLLP